MTLKSFILSCFMAAAMPLHAQNTSTLKCSVSPTLCDSVAVRVSKTDDISCSRQEKFATAEGAHRITTDSPYAVSMMVEPMQEDAKERMKNMLYIIVLPGENVSVDCADDGRYTVTGSAFYKEHEKVERLLQNETTRDGKNAIRRQYVKDNPTSPYAAYLAAMDLFDKAELITLLADEARNGAMKHFIGLAAQEKKKEDAERNRLYALEGNKAPDFTAKDINGKDVTLSDMFGKGKFILLDFWGSWCTWCLKAVPKMKSLYEEHKSKLEIVSIDCNDTEEKWKKAVKDHDLTWTNVKSERANNIATLYSVVAFPSFVLIDTDGKVVKVQSGGDETLFSFIKDTLK